MTRPPKTLALEDRVMWSRVARTARPLPGKPIVADVELETDDGRKRAANSASGIRPEPPTPGQWRPAHALHRIDPTTRRKIAKGRIAIEARIDLHGLTQGQAHGFLLDFLRRAYGEGTRYVLVITGKGSSFGSVGVLRRAVPEWLATPPFSAFVSGYEDAARTHGGAGALYVRLRPWPRRKDSSNDAIR